ncbi:MAG TPA: undecaprenyldiphospho-muramoylpentapeptide beta-N-acetylglucosaminyltransferase [bacterium]|nr:undecaprenyldiphospho-muramoylpentapeptide beta-N-acetylglucosaminyltransferase [bacterium]
MTTAEKTILIAGGKTGGHLFPGIAVAEVLRQRGLTVVFVGSRGGLEEKELPARGFTLEFVTVGGLKGKNIIETIKNLAVLPIALLQALRLIGKHRADAVVSLGGFAAGPVALAAWLRRRAVYAMEQNSIPGITNRIVGRFADRIFMSFPDVRGRFPAGRTLLTGNPVRREVIDCARKRLDTDRPVLAVFGGSQGAASLNELMMRLVADHPAVANGFYIIHQTGERDLAAVRAHYAAHGVEAEIQPFVRDIGSYYKAADIIVCRAGATTIAELAALGKPAIYVPFPHAADNHQYYNARSVVEQGGGIVVEDAGPVAEKAAKLAAALDQFAKNREVWRSRMTALTENRADVVIADAILSGIGGGAA